MDEIDGEWLLLCPPTQRGSVMKCMPYVDEWSGKVPFIVLDERITEEIFHKTLVDAGAYIGLGRFRPQCGGFYGRFEVKDIEWS